MKVIRQAKDRDLSDEVKATREEKRRRHEIDAQIVNALEKGNHVDLLLTHPAGLMGKGSAGHLHADRKQEETFIRNRYNQLKARFDSGTEFAELDAAIADEVKRGKRNGDHRLDRLSEIKARGVASKRGENGEQLQRFARARALKDYSEFEYQEWAKSAGVLIELSEAEIVAEHEANVVNVMAQINEEREQLGLPRMKIVEE